MGEGFSQQLASTQTLDWHHPAVGAFVRAQHDPAAGEIERAVQLYYAVRDLIRYDPYTSGVTRESLRASAYSRMAGLTCIRKGSTMGFRTASS